METSVSLEKNCKSLFFPLEKTVLLEKIKVLTPKTRFSSGKVYFTSEILLYSGKIQKQIPFHSIIKICFVRKIHVLTMKTKFSYGKIYFTSEIVFYSGNLRLSTEKLVNTVFFHYKKPFC